MRPVSINDFIRIVYGDDSNPPSPATIKRQCSKTDDQGRPLIPGAYRAGKPWKIDLDTYLPEMERRIRGDVANEDPRERHFIDDLAARLAS